MGLGGRRDAETTHPRVAPDVDPAPAPAPPLRCGALPLLVVDRAAAVAGRVDDEVLAADAPGHFTPVANVAGGPVVVGGVEEEAAHLGDPHLPQQTRSTASRLPVARAAFDVDGGIGQLRQQVDAVAQRRDPVVPAALLEAVDGAQRVGLVRDHHAAVADGVRHHPVPRLEALVLGLTPTGVVGSAGHTVVAQRRHQWYLALALSAGNVVPDLLGRVGASRAAEPAELRLDCDRLVHASIGGAALPQGALPLNPRMVLGVDEQSLTGKRVRGAGIDSAGIDDSLSACLGGEHQCKREQDRTDQPSQEHGPQASQRS